MSAAETYEPTRRQSGKTTTQEIAQEQRKTAFEQLPAGTDDGETQRLKRPFLHRIRKDFTHDQSMVMQQVHTAVDNSIKEVFGDAFDIMAEIYLIVREQEFDKDGDPLFDQYRLPVWKKNASGSYIEDWSKLGHRVRERFLFLITTRLFEWEQRVQEAWVESMFAKALWEQTFAEGFESLPAISATKPTVDDRTQRGRVVAGEDYYFALVATYYSRRAEAIVRSMQSLAQRIKDVHTAQ